MTTIALLLALQMPSHVEAPPGEIGEVRRSFTGTRWVAVSIHARLGKAEVLEATGVFVGNNELDITLRLTIEAGRVETKPKVHFRPDPRSQLPAIAPDSAGMCKGGAFRQQGERLSLDLEIPQGKVQLLLKQVK